jgi:hypothetical protein
MPNLSASIVTAVREKAIENVSMAAMLRFAIYKRDLNTIRMFFEVLSTNIASRPQIL